MSFKIIEQTLASDLAASGTLNVSYPTGYGRGNFILGKNHKIRAGNTALRAPGDFTITLNATNFTITMDSAASTILAGTKLLIELDMAGDGEPERVKRYSAFEPQGSVQLAEIAIINLGSPITADADGIATVQTTAGAGKLTLNGVRVSGGVATLDVPRNVTLTGATTDHSAVTATITGTDEYGETLVEEIACPNDNTVAGKKAFKTVTNVEVDGAIATNGISVGFGDVLGLPCFLRSTGLVLKELENGAAATAGTVVAGSTAEATATTGDVRGTYDPNSDADGSKAFALIVAMLHRDDRGVAQYGG